MSEESFSDAGDDGREGRKWRRPRRGFGQRRREQGVQTFTWTEALGKQGIPTSATSDAGYRGTSRKNIADHPYRVVERRSGGYHPREGGKGVSPGPGQFGGDFTPRGGCYFVLLHKIIVRYYSSHKDSRKENPSTVKLNHERCGTKRSRAPGGIYRKQ
ncbi:hypothetical protein BDM02DRAFT_2273108 [Thelephora ganbajun]|uniref:Uncharacterized protein n=1 Tax=Thelephora ganbajun TaxID=370292 RepID=A0ACB6ZF67_THEGA|nr:hypothetical protein BDM02DRAFT_2273108 [Thelephora ganbajun]